MHLCVLDPAKMTMLRQAVGPFIFGLSCYPRRRLDPRPWSHRRSLCVFIRVSDGSDLVQRQDVNLLHQDIPQVGLPVRSPTVTPSL